MIATISDMDLKAIIDAAADDADQFLGSASSKKDAQPLIRDYLKENHPELSAPDVMRVAAGLTALLDGEGFFEGQPDFGDSWGEQTSSAPGSA